MGFFSRVDWVSWLPQKMHPQITPKSFDHDHAEEKKKKGQVSYFCFIRLFMSEHDIWSSWSRLNQLQPPLDCAAFQLAMWPVKMQPLILFFRGGGVILKTVRQRLMGTVKYGECGWNSGCRIYRHFVTMRYSKLPRDAKLHVVAE